MTNEQLENLWIVYKSLGVEGLKYNHYDLAKITDVANPELWREFLINPDVSDWVQTERALIQESELNKMIQGIGGSNSVGKAQLMTALAKLTERTTVKEGPIFIYTYVPLSPEQESAPNVVKLAEDPFLKPRGV